MPDALPELLAAAKRSPTDDAPRRALADHLSAAGDPERAEFLRLQLAQTDDGEWHPNQCDEQVAIGRLLKKHVRRWAGVPYAGPHWFKFSDRPASEDDDSPHASGRFDRGLLRVTGTAAGVRAALDRLPTGSGEWLEMLDLSGVSTAAELRALLTHPNGRHATAFDVAADDDAPADVFDPLDAAGVRELRLTGTSGAMLRRVAAFKAARPHRLSVEFDADDQASAEAVFASPLLADVRAVEIGLDDQDPKLLAALARAPHLRALTDLFLSGDEFPHPLLRDLFASDGVKQLRTLTVSGYAGHLTGVTDALVRGGARQIEDLDLGFNVVSTDEAVALAKSDLLAGVRALDFGSGELTTAGAVAIVQSPNAANLTRLGLSNTHVGEDAVFALAQSPHLKNLRELDLCRCEVTAKSLRALALSPHLSNLERLDISMNPLPPFALDALSSSRTLGKLKVLALRQLVIANDTFDRLFRSPVTAQLEQLDLQGTMLSKAKLRGLVEATSFGRLRKLTLGENILMRGEVDVLGEADWLSQLADLALYNTKMTDAGVRTLTAKLTPGRLGRLDLSRNLLTDESADALLNWPGLGGLTDLSVYQSGLSDALAEQVRRAAWGT